MPIDISGINSGKTQQSSNERQTKPVGEDAQQSGQAQTPPAATDKVSLTETAARLKALERALGDVPVVDGRRVSELQRALAEGSYEIDDQRIAEKLIEFERQLKGHV